MRARRPAHIVTAFFVAALFAAASGAAVLPPLAAATDNPPPFISSTTPSAAVVGGDAFTLVVDGDGYVPASQILWNGVPRPTVYLSPTRLTAAIPGADITAAQTAQVTVVNPPPGGGSSAAVGFRVGDANPTPSVTGLSPERALVAGQAFNLTVIGAGFVPGSVVRWNGADRATGFIFSSMLTASIPAGDLATAGIADVTVFSPAPGGGVSATMEIFMIANPEPVVASVEPASAWTYGPGFMLVVHGSGFSPQSVVLWSGSDRPTTYVSSERLEAQIASADLTRAGATTVRVFTPGPGGGFSSGCDVAVQEDVHPPVTMVEGLSHTWNRSAVTLRLIATDVGVGVERTFYRCGTSGDFSVGSKVTVAAPKSHKNDGLHVVEYFSIDKVLNWETTQRVKIGIDTQPPTTTVGNVDVEKGGTLRARYRIADPVSPATMNARLLVRDSTGKVVLRVLLGSPRTNWWYGSPGRTVLLPRGIYQLSVLASDLAGNPQAKVTTGRLRVL